MLKFKNVANQDIKICIPEGNFKVAKDDIVELPISASQYPQFLIFQQILWIFPQLKG